MKEQRIEWIDLARGYGVILVIWAHLQDEGLRSWIYSFHMPLFFMLSGYVFNASYVFKKFILKKIKRIIVPYFCLGVPMVLFQTLADSLNGDVFLERLFLNINLLLLQKRLWTLWYLAVLFFVNIFFYIMVRWCKNEKIILVLSFLLAIMGVIYYQNGGGPWVWNVDTCFTAMPFFAVGYYVKVRLKDRIFNMSGWVIKGVFVALLLLNIVCCHLSQDENGVGLEMFYCKYGNPIYTYIAAFAGVYCLFILSYNTRNYIIKYIGENSMLFFAWHQTIMIPVITRIFSIINVSALLNCGRMGLVLYKILILIIVLVITKICIDIIRKLRLEFILGE